MATEQTELRGSEPIMTSKDLLIELYRDMKFVRPAVESLLAAGVITRIEKLEDDNKARLAAAAERSRLGSLTNRGLAVLVIIANFVLGLWVAFANHVVPGLPK